MTESTRTRKHIEMEICELEKEFLFYQKYNRLSAARLERLKIEELQTELEAMWKDEPRGCYVG